MTLTVTIGGVAMTGDSHFVQEDSVQHVNALGQRDTFTCVIVSKDGTYAPDMGAPILVADDVGNRFGGSIRNVSIDQFGLAVVTTIQCASWEQIFDRRLTGALSYPQPGVATAGDIFQDLLTRYTGAEGITASIVVTGPTIASVSFDFCSVRQAFDTICELASDDTDTYMWDCTADKVARFYKQTSFAAPIDVDDSSTEIMRPITLSRTFDGYSNKVFVRVGKFITEARTDTFHPDGTERTFTFELPLAAEPTIVLDGVVQTVGVKDADTGSQWYWQDGSPDVTQDPGETIPSSSSVLDVTAQGYQSTVVDAGENTPEVTARGTAEDNSGWYMILLEASEARTYADAQATGQAWLDTHSELPWSAAYLTARNGFKAGQHQSISLTTFGVTLSATFLIESVTLFQSGGFYGFRVTAVDGVLANNWLSKLRKIAMGQGSTAGTNVSVSTAGSGSVDSILQTVAPDGGGNVALDLGAARRSFRVVLDGSTMAMSAPTFTGGTIAAGMRIWLYFEQDATGSRPGPATWDAAFAADGGRDDVDGAPSVRTMQQWMYDGALWCLDIYRRGVAIA
jgi:hypothetical protein